MPKNRVVKEFFEAIRLNDEKKVREMMVGGISPNERDALYYTALERAAEKGFLGIARLLVRNGAVVDSVSELGVTPLMRAAFGGHEDMVRFLISKGADPRKRDYAGLSVGWFAHLADQRSIEKILRVASKKRRDEERN